VTFVGGAGRSGSTVLALLLAQLPGFVAAGGVSNLWERGLRGNYLCGCGARFQECPFWTAVGDAAFGGWDRIDADAVLALRAEVARYRHLLWYAAPRLRPAFANNLAAYTSYMAPVYGAIRTVSGARVVVDTSHDVMSALLLREVPRVEARVLHLVRDSRAVAFSLSRRRARPEVPGAEALMPRYAPVPASIEWMAGNLPYHLVPRRSLPRLRIRYESLTAAPVAEVARVVDFLGVPVAPAAVAKLGADSIALADIHMISGNPHRLGRRAMQVRLDAEWRTAMRRRDRLVVTAMTLPLGVSYRYVGRPPRRLTPARGPDRRDSRRAAPTRIRS
jgi:hypothetical protein